MLLIHRPERLLLGGIYGAQAWRPLPKYAGLSRDVLSEMFQDGKSGHFLLWEDVFPNIVVTEGLQHILDILFVSATAQIDPFFVGLTDDSPTFAAPDTLASHAGWTEFDEYTGNRQTYVDVRTALQVSNSASPASFPITGAGGGLGGAFLAAVATGSADILLSGGALTGGNRIVAALDTVNLTYNFTGADDGV